MSRQKSYGTRIIANNMKISNNTFETGRNNNDLIVGPSGAGKTEGYVIPNIRNTTDSFIAVDTKGTLYRRTAAELEKKGYKVLLIDFKNPEKSTIGYNPFDFIRVDAEDEPNEMDISKITTILNPAEEQGKDPFWAYAAAKYMGCTVSYMFAAVKDEEHNMQTVYELAPLIGSEKWNRMIEEVMFYNPKCLAVKRTDSIVRAMKAEKMHSSIIGVLDTNLARVSAKELGYLYNAKERINFQKLGEEKIALFVNVSDSDRSLDQLLNLFYTQAFQELIARADEEYDGRLKVPVRLFLDDFASNFVIPNFDGIASIIRSRDIYMSLVIQSLSQLDSMYGEYKARTIINNCDVQLYLGGQDVPTAQYYSMKSNRPLDKVLQMPLNKMFLFIRGSEPKLVDRYDYISHFQQESDEKDSIEKNTQEKED